MRVKIKIDCEDEEELMQHLFVIKTRIQKLIRKENGVISHDKKLKDNNCHGSHKVKIIV